MPDWAALLGRPLGDRFELAELIEQSETRAVFRVSGHAEPESHARAVLVRDTPGAQELLETWERSQAIRHPHVSFALAAGRQGEADFVYAVFETPDERLDEVLRERPLDPQETGELLRAVISGLEEIHGRGWVHGSVSPEEIFAVGDLVKISSGGSPTPSRYRAPESVEENRTVQADVWCLGATLFEMLTQRRYRSEDRESARKFSAPLGSIVYGCLHADPNARLTLSEISALQRGELVDKLPLPSVPESRQITARGTWPFWIYALVAAELVLIALLWLGESKRAGAGTRVAYNGAEAAPADVQGADTSSLNEVDISRAGEAKDDSSSGWRVVLSKSDGREQAERQLKALKDKWPGVKVEVIGPNAGRGPYMLAAGGVMTREQALIEKSRLTGMGVKGDISVQNLGR